MSIGGTITVDSQFLNTLLSVTVSSIEQAIGDLNDEISDLESQISSLESSMTSENAAQVQAQINALKKQVGQKKAQVAAYSISKTIIIASMTSVIERFDWLENNNSDVYNALKGMIEYFLNEGMDVNSQVSPNAILGVANTNAIMKIAMENNVATDGMSWGNVKDFAIGLGASLLDNIFGGYLKTADHFIQLFSPQISGNGLDGDMFGLPQLSDGLGSLGNSKTSSYDQILGELLINAELSVNNKQVYYQGKMVGDIAGIAWGITQAIIGFLGMGAGIGIGVGGTAFTLGAAVVPASIIGSIVGVSSVIVAASGAIVTVNSFDNLRNNYSNYNYFASKSSNIGGSYNPSGNAIGNMQEFFNTDFGKTLKNKVSKTGQQKDGQSIYKVQEKTGNQYLNKGDQFYLDGLHKDHLEVFDKRGKFKAVLNLDGSFNESKTAKAIGRTI